MISFSNINKQYGKQLVFVDASFQLNPGEKVGLVGPNGAGKTTLFRMVVGEEAPDEGEVSVPKKLTIGYFRQDVEEMKGRSVLDEAIAGSGRVGDLHHELEDLQRAMEDPEQADDMDRILARFGEVQEEYEHLGGYALEAQAREVLHGLGFKDDQIDGDVGALSGGWKMRVALARVLLGRPDVLLMDEPTNHLDIESIIWLEQFLKSYSGRAADDLARPRVHEPPGIEDRRDRCGRDHRVLGQLRFLRARARHSRDQSAGGLRAAAVHAGQGAALYRALQDARGQGGAGAEPHQGARQDRQDRAAEEAAGGEVRVPRAAAIGRPGGGDRRSAQELRAARDLRRVQSDDPARRALGGDGPERRGQDHAAQDDRGRERRPMPEACGWARA